MARMLSAVNSKEEQCFRVERIPRGEVLGHALGNNGGNGTEVRDTQWCVLEHALPRSSRNGATAFTRQMVSENAFTQQPCVIDHSTSRTALSVATHRSVRAVAMV